MSAQTSIGGQAVPEGVMLRGPRGWAVAVRRLDGQIAVSSHPNRRTPNQLWRRPLLRGLHAVGSALPLGMRSMSVADRLRHVTPPPPPSRKAVAWFVLSLAGSLAMAVVLFGLLPNWVRDFAASGHVLDHAIEPGVRTAMIVAYIAAVGLLPDIRRVFAYHGAEHQVVSAHEFGATVDAASARNFTRFHPRCGTTFVLLVAVLDGVVHLVVPLPSGAIFRAVQVPVAIMLAYELLHLAVAAPNRAWARVVLAPGRALQRLTTRPPDHGQLEGRVRSAGRRVAPRRSGSTAG